MLSDLQFNSIGGKKMNDLVSRQAVLDMAIYTPVAPILVGGSVVWRHVIFKEMVSAEI